MNGGARFLTTWLNNSIEIERKILTAAARRWSQCFFCFASFSAVLSLYYLCAKCVSKCPSPPGNSGAETRSVDIHHSSTRGGPQPCGGTCFYNFQMVTECSLPFPPDTMQWALNFCSDKGLDSFYLQILWSTVRGSPVSRLHLSLEPLAAGCWSHHQYTKYKYNANRESFCMFTGVALEDGELVRRQLGLTAAAVCITCRCLCSVPCLQSAVCWLLAWLETVSPGAAAHPSAEISSAVRTLSPHVATLVPRGHTRDTWPGKKICTHWKFCLTSRFPKTEFGAGSVGARGRCRGVSQPPVTASCKL